MLCDNEQVRMFTLRAACRQIDVTITEINATPYHQHIDHLKQDMYFHSVVITTEQSQVPTYPPAHPSILITIHPYPLPPTHPPVNPPTHPS